jgi:alkylation response protein AidB-like acyl-CoA dehydrogenase
MAQEISDRRDMDFVLYEQLEMEKLIKNEKFAGFNRKTLDLILTEARNLAIKELLPINAAGDREGCRFENGIVKVPESFHRAFKLYREGEWIAMLDDPEVGGQGLPVTVALAIAEYFNGANCAFGMYPGLCHGAGKLIEIFGTQPQKELFLKNMYSGKWGGSMLLTEPQAGSDVGALTTSAVRNPDGTYSITGNKIFITGGEQNLTENIIHPVLARIEGAPAGTRGISLFIVPKIWVNADGSLGESNDVVCTGIEEKMGIHGSATCSLTLGGKGKCLGFLLGEENKGMKGMFHMMNEARLGVGLQGFSMASAAYMHALNYARERIQGKSLLSMMDPAAPSIAIINHPDVRRMLLWMKANVDGMRSFLYYVGSCFDRVAISSDPETKDHYQGLIEVLTPIIKAYCADRAFEVCTQAIQVYGGYGYTQEYPVEQLLRDCKITSLYEGTNGIQAMDFLGRKLGMKQGKYFMSFLSEIQKTITAARSFPALEPLAEQMEKGVNRLGEIAMALGMNAMSPKVMTAFSFAQPFLEVTGDVIMAWMHLWRATVAAPKLEKLAGSLDEAARKKAVQDDKQAVFYEGEFRCAEYYLLSVLPGTLGRMKAISIGSSAAMDMPDPAFG